MEETDKIMETIKMKDRGDTKVQRKRKEEIGLSRPSFGNTDKKGGNLEEMNLVTMNDLDVILNDKNKAKESNDLTGNKKSTSKSRRHKWEGHMILIEEEGKLNKVLLTLERLDINFEAGTLRTSGFDLFGSFEMEGNIDEETKEVLLVLKREKNQNQTFFKGAFSEDLKEIRGVYAFKREELDMNSEQKFDLIQLPTFEEAEDEENVAEDEEKLAGFVMTTITDSCAAFVLKDLPSSLYLFNTSSMEIETEIPIKILKGGSSIRMSPDNLHLVVAGTIKSLYLVNGAFLIDHLIKMSPEILKKLFPSVEKGRKKSRKIGINEEKAKKHKKEKTVQNELSLPKDFLIELKHYHKDIINIIEFIEEGKKMVTAGGTQIKVFDFERRSVDRFFDTSHTDNITRLVFVTENQRMITGGEDKKVLLTDFSTGREIQVLDSFHGAGIVGLYYIEANNTLISASSDGEISRVESFTMNGYLGMNGLMRVGNKDLIEKENQTKIFRYYFRREPTFPTMKIDFFTMLFMCWRNVSLIALQELIDIAFKMNVVPVLSPINITAFEMFEVYEPPPIFSELLIYFYFRQMKHVTRYEYQLSEHFVYGGLINYYMERKSKNVLTHFFSAMMVENATYNPSEIYLRGRTTGKFKLSNKLFADFTGDELYDPRGTIPLKVFRSKIRIEDPSDRTSKLILLIFQMFLNFSNKIAFNLETTQQLLFYLKARTSKFAYFLISLYFVMIAFLFLLIIYYDKVDPVYSSAAIIIILGGNCLFTLAEIVQIIGQGLKEYFKSYENVFEVSQICLTFVFTIYALFRGLETLDEDSTFTNILAMSVLTSVVRMSRIIRYFEIFRPLVLKLNQIIFDMTAITLILIIYVIGFGFIHYVMAIQMNYSEDIRVVDYIGFSWDTAWANYNREDFVGNLGTFIYFVQTLFIPLVLMNLVIAIMGDTLGDMSHQMVEMDSIAKMEVCLDYMYTSAGIIKFFQKFFNKKTPEVESLFNNSLFLFVVFADETPAIKEQTDDDDGGNPLEAQGVAAAVAQVSPSGQGTELNIDQIAQATTKITLEQVTKMRERLEKTLCSVVLKVHDDLENQLEDHFARLNRRIDQLEKNQVDADLFMKKMEKRIQTVEEIQNQTLGVATKAAQFAGTAVKKIPDDFQSLFVGESAPSKSQIGGFKGKETTVKIKANAEGILKSNRIQSRLMGESQLPPNPKISGPSPSNREEPLQPPSEEEKRDDI